jgi:hypothetical protein
MFRQLADAVQQKLTPQMSSPMTRVAPPAYTAADVVFTYHPEQLSLWLEEMWALGGIASWNSIFTTADTQIQPVPLGVPNAVNMFQLPIGLSAGSGFATPSPPFPPLPWGRNQPAWGHNQRTNIVSGAWDHLLYAYLVESTGVFEILAEVVRRYVVGESLPTPTIETMAWVRATEELFFRDPPLFRIGGLTSQLRPNARINRRSDYWRMFALDLPHPAPGIDGQPWKQGPATVVNSRFLELWNELLRQVWLGIENDRNQNGTNPTDDNYIGYLCQTIGEMLRLRRRGGMLSREEFSDVCMMNWFHLTVLYDDALVRDLSANAGDARGNPADRLAAIGARVGVAPSRQARELFELANVVSPLMWAIEVSIFDTPSAARLLYHSSGVSTPNAAADTMNRIIDLWQSATGQNVKDLATTQRRVQMPARSAQPTKLLPTQTLVTTTAPSTNGHAVASQS